MNNIELPWSDDQMLRWSHPMYNAWCREDEDEEGEDPDTRADFERDNLRDMELEYE